VVDLAGWVIEEKKRFWWNEGKKTEPEEDNNFKPAFSPHFQLGPFKA